MNTFFVSITGMLVSVFIAIAGLFTPVSDKKTEKIANNDENCRLSMAVLSDTHLDGTKFLERMLEYGMLDISKASDKLDAVVFDGDITNLGKPKQYDSFTRAVSLYDSADKILFSIGNHDTWCGTWEDADRSAEESISLFCEYQKKISGIETRKPYFSTQLNGYTLIFLGSEGNGVGAYVSEEQIKWFDTEMAKTKGENKPVFVFMHQSFNGTHGLPYNWEMKEANPDKGGIGEASDKILDIIKQYKNVFYISGHIHAGFSDEDDKNCYVSIEQHDGYTLVNIPSYTKGDFSHGGINQIGTGYVIEVYDNEVLFRARNFITGTYLKDYDRTFDIAK